MSGIDKKKFENPCHYKSNCYTVLSVLQIFQIFTKIQHRQFISQFLCFSTIPCRVFSAKIIYKKTFLILVILAITFFFAIGYSFNDAQAQETVSKSVAAMGGVDSYDVSETNIVYNFNELSLFSTWYYIQYPYARFTPYPGGYFRVDNHVSDYSYYPNFITNDYLYYNFGGVDVQFTQSVRNLSFTTVGVNGGNLYFTSNHIDMLRWRVKSPGEGE